MSARIAEYADLEKQVFLVSSLSFSYAYLFTEGRLMYLLHGSHASSDVVMSLLPSINVSETK